MDVDEVMRACGGAVQGIRDRGCYHNRGNDGCAPRFSFLSSCFHRVALKPRRVLHPGGNPWANLKSSSHRCHPILVDLYGS